MGSVDPVHSPYSASGAHRWLRCPGSVALCADEPDRTSEYALEGTRAHELAEMVLRDEDDQIDWDTVSDEMHDAVMLYVDTVTEVLNSSSPGRELYVEKKFSLEHIHEDMYGTNDAIIVDPYVHAYVFDLKYGKGVKVEAENNYQMMYYALGALHQEPVESVTLVIVQPRFDPDNPISKWEVSMDRLKEYAEELKAGIGRCLAENPDIVPGESQCRFCDAKYKCPAIIAETQELTALDFTSDDTPDMPVASAMTDDFISRVMAHEKLMKSWLTSIQEEAMSRLQSGGSIPGYKLVQRTGHRKFTCDEDTIIKQLIDGGVLKDIDDAYDVKLKSPAQLEKVTGKEGKPIIAQYTETPDIGLGVVPESNKKPAVHLGNDFTDSTE